MEDSCAASQADLDRIAAELCSRFTRAPAKKILLVHPPAISTDLMDLPAARNKRYAAYPPYGLLVIGEILRKNGYEVRVVDLNFEVLKRIVNSQAGSDEDYTAAWREILRSALDGFCPDLVGVTCMFTMTYSVFRETILEIKRHVNVPVAIGGVYVTNDTEKILRDIGVADVACTHESEISFLKLLKFINGAPDMPAADLCQLAMLIGDQYLEIRKKYLPKSEELDIIPAFDLVDTSNYSQVGYIGTVVPPLPEGARLSTVVTNRGCRARCTFCSVHYFNGPGVRARSVANVVDELQLLADVYGIRHITWLDDDLFWNETRTIELFHEMARRKLPITWDASNGVIAAATTKAIMEAAVAAGCIGLYLGIESGNPQMLREMKKPGTVDKFRQAATLLKNYPRLCTRGFLIIGFPHETLRMMMDTLNLALEMDLDWYNISTLQALSSTQIYQTMKEEGLLDTSVATDDVRYSIGPHGKQTQLERGQKLAAPSFEEEFSKLKMDETPPKDQLPNIWFYLNFKINFERLERVTDPVKIGVRLKIIRDIADRITSDHALAHYYTAVLEEKSGNSSEAMRRIGLTESALAGSAYWRDKFGAFQLYDRMETLKNRSLVSRIYG